MNSDNTTVISLQDLLGALTRLKIEGYRLVTLTGLALGTQTVEILYHLDKDFQLCHLRLTVPTGMAVPSISSIFPAAFLAENEIQDGFPIRFSGLAVDYQGRMLRSSATVDAAVGVSQGV